MTGVKNMADANQESTDSPKETTDVVDPIKNFKSEMDRKLGNITDQLKAQNDAMAAQLAAIAQSVAPKQQQQQKVDLSELAYTDPEAYAEAIAQKVSSRVDQKLQSNNSVNSTIQQMVSDYPELNDPNSDLYAKAMSAYSKLSASERESASGVRLAIREAAADAGIIPVSKRKKSSDNDDFAFGSSMGNESNDNKRDRTKTKEKEIDPLTSEWSRLLGRDPEDKKVKDGLKKAVQRNDYKRYK